MSTAVVSALGAVLGFLGHVAEESIFERLFWPQRFFNYVNLESFVRIAVFGPLGGPVHRAALQTLDKFRDHGLYKGRARGDFLGTAAFPVLQGIQYVHATATSEKDRKLGKPVRNGFWIRVIQAVGRRVGTPAGPRTVTSFKSDEESSRKDSKAPLQNATFRRATRPIFRLHLDFLSGEQGQQRKHIRRRFSEESLTLWTFVGVFLSELSSIAIALATSLWYGLSEDHMGNAPAVWYIVYSLLPLVFKLLAVLLCVRREGMVSPRATAQKETETPPMEASASPGACSFVEFFEVEADKIGFILISTQAPASTASFQFTRHYGHPLRLSYQDRAREIASMAVIFAFMFYFPAGLLVLSWMNIETQYLWLSQQLFCVVVMHIARLTGWEGYASIENGIAECLYRDGVAVLVGKNACVKASLVIEEVHSILEGRERVKAILAENESARPAE